MNGVPPPRLPLQPMNPDALRPESDVPPAALGGDHRSDRPLSGATKVGAALPLFTASFALIVGLSTDVAPNGSWRSDDMLKALVAVGAIGGIGGAALLAMFRAWGPERSTAVKVLLFLGISAVKLAALAASMVLWIAVSITRDPPEC